MLHFLRDIYLKQLPESRRGKKDIFGEGIDF